MVNSIIRRVATTLTNCDLYLLSLFYLHLLFKVLPYDI